MKSRIAGAKAAEKNKALYTSKLDLNLRKKTRKVLHWEDEVVWH